MNVRKIWIPVVALAFVLPAIAVEGATETDIGFSLGEEYKEAYTKYLDNFWDLVEDRGSTREGILEWAKNHVEILREYYPERLGLLEEVSTSTGIGFLEMVAISSLLPIEGGCTVSGSTGPATKDGKTYMSWNMDLSFMGKPVTLLLSGIWALIPQFSVVQMPDRYSYFVAGLPLSCGIGVMNEKGLALSANAVDSTDYGDGLTHLEIISMVLERCETAEEAVELMKSVPIFSGTEQTGMLWNMNYLWADAEGGMVSVECTHNHFHAEYAGEEGILAQANHFQYLDCYEVGGPTPEDDYESSWMRGNRMRDLLQRYHGEIDVELLQETIVTDTQYTVGRFGREWGTYDSICREFFGQFPGRVPVTTLCVFVSSPMDKKIYLNPGDPKIFNWIEIDVGSILEDPSILVELLYSTIAPFLQPQIVRVIALAIKALARIPG